MYKALQGYRIGILIYQEGGNHITWMVTIQVFVLTNSWQLHVASPTAWSTVMEVSTVSLRAPVRHSAGMPGSVGAGAGVAVGGEERMFL
jgi:hypothetical protein